MTTVAEVSDVETALRSLMERTDGPFVIPLPRAAGTRDVRYANLLSGPVDETEVATESASTAVGRPGLSERVGELEARVAELERVVAALGGR
jgi:hypothetical protein